MEIRVAREEYPVRMVDLMREAELEGNVIVFFDWAEYCIWHLYPRCRVFLDGRFRSAYGPQAIIDYLNFLYGEPGWQRALLDYDTELVLAHMGNPCSDLLRRHPDWQSVREEPPAVLFARKQVAGEISSRLRTAAVTAPRRPPIFP